MILGMIIYFIVIGFGVLAHDRARFEERVYNNIPLYDWFLITLFPIGCYIATALFVHTILLRPEVRGLPFSDFEIMTVGILIMIYAISGNSIHFTSKVLWRYLDKEKQKTAYDVNELFHGKLSHMLIFGGVALIMLCISLLEVNHPLPEAVPYVTQMGVFFMSILTGVCAVKMVIKSKHDSWYVTRPMFSVGVLIALFHLYVLYEYDVSLLTHPFNMYTIIFLLTFIAGFLLRKIYWQITKSLPLPQFRRS